MHAYVQSFLHTLCKLQQPQAHSSMFNPAAEPLRSHRYLKLGSAVNSKGCSVCMVNLLS